MRRGRAAGSPTWAGRAVACDVTDEAAARAAFTAVERADVLVNSAGIFSDKPLAEVTAADLRRMYEVNTVCLFVTTQAALARMPNGGRIVNLASPAYLGPRDHAHSSTARSSSSTAAAPLARPA